MICPFCTNGDPTLIESKKVSKFIEGVEVKVIIYDCQVCSKRWASPEKEKD